MNQTHWSVASRRGRPDSVGAAAGAGIRRGRVDLSSLRTRRDDTDGRRPGTRCPSRPRRLRGPAAGGPVPGWRRRPLRAASAPHSTPRGTAVWSRVRRPWPCARLPSRCPPACTRAATSAPADGTLEHFPLYVDVPDITLHGALRMALDADGRATGIGAGGVESTLAPVEPLPVVNGVLHPAADRRRRALRRIPPETDSWWRASCFQSGHDPAVDAGGQGVLALRVSGLVVRGNRFEGGFTESVDLRGTNGEVGQNHLSGTAGTCDICLAGPRELPRLRQPPPCRRDSRNHGGRRRRSASAGGRRAIPAAGRRRSRGRHREQ